MIREMSTANPTQPTVRESGTGEPVICLHASASSGGQWRGLIERLSAQWRVMAPDQFGYCRNTPQERIQSFVLADELDWLEPVFDRAGEHFHLVGHSYGGLIALLATMRWPNRVRSLALYEPAAWSVAVSDDPADPASIELDTVAQSVIRGVDAGQADDTAAEFVDYWSGRGAWNSMPPERRVAVTRVMPKISREFISERADHDAGIASISAYSRISVPTLLMTGARSTAGARKVCKLLRGVWPDCQFVELQELGHMAPATNPNPIIDEVHRFLSEVR